MTASTYLHKVNLVIHIERYQSLNLWFKTNNALVKVPYNSAVFSQRLHLLCRTSLICLQLLCSKLEQIVQSQFLSAIDYAWSLNSGAYKMRNNDVWYSKHRVLQSFGDDWWYRTSSQMTTKFCVTKESINSLNGSRLSNHHWLSLIQNQNHKALPGDFLK